MQELLKFLDLTTLDATMILVAIPLFLLFLKGSNKYLISPYLTRLNERDRLTVGAGNTAEATLQEAAALENDYARKIADARAAAVKSKAAGVTAAREEAARIIAQAEADVASKVSAERTKVREQLDAQRAALMKDVESLAQGIVQKMMQPRSLSIILLLLSSFLILMPGDLFAEAAHGVADAHGAADGHGAGHGYGYLFWYWVNFLVYLTVMYFILRKIVADGWIARRERIKFALEAGKRSLDQARARLQAAQAKLAQVEAEIRDLTQSVATEGKNEEQKILKDATAHAADIQAHAAESLGLEARAQKAQMQREIAEVVLARATAMLKSTVTSESDRVLRSGAVSGVKNLIQ